MTSDTEIPVWAIDAINALLQTLKLKDPFTFYHCCRVGRASRRLANALGLSEHEQNILEFSGLLHDVGKVGIPDDILLKPSRLTDEEMTKMKSHAELSCEIIKPLMHIPFFRFLLPGIRYHHEQYDGSGYPSQLSGERIPLAARVIAVVDTVDAMTHTRPYRKALSIERALQELR
ncbi:MAG: HD domain-containing protein, partial [Bdellovibrionales bacterium]|nr:HD domain-containing protein [Bdellovibrionales bacterium]